MQSNIHSAAQKHFAGAWVSKWVSKLETKLGPNHLVDEKRLQHDDNWFMMHFRETKRVSIIKNYEQALITLMNIRVN